MNSTKTSTLLLGILAVVLVAGAGWPAARAAEPQPKPRQSGIASSDDAQAKPAEPGGEGRSSTYTTKFEGAEDPLSENGKWSNNSQDWTKIRKKDGVAHGTQTGTNAGAKVYDDSFAHLSGFPPDQEAWATVHITKPNAACHQEVEILLRWTSSAHRTTGYECNARCLNNGSSYMEVVRWDGPLAKYTYLARRGGPDYGLKHGDVLKASIIGNVITVYLNGVQKIQVSDDTFKAGDPGIGLFLQCNGREGIGSNADFGFSSFSARPLQSGSH